MGFAEDKVYDHILKNLKNFRNIHVSSLANSLSCLTDADRDELHAREEMRGSHATIYRFYQHLKCRQGWVQDLIDALHQNNAGHLADELQQVYEFWQTCIFSPDIPTPKPSIAASFPFAASNARPTSSSISARTLSPAPNPAPGAPLAMQPHPDLPASGCPPLLPSAATATSVDLDTRAPVQESLPKKLQEHESPQPPPPRSTVHARVSDGHSGEGHLPHPVESLQAAVGTPQTGSMAVPSAELPKCGREWLSRQQHPVCVDNGCFGNANHLQRGVPSLGLGRSLPPRDAGAAHSPEQPRNEPEENIYLSTASPLRTEETTRSREPQAHNSLPKNQAVPNSEHSETQGSFVDVRSPLLIQQQFDAEQELFKTLKEHRRDAVSFVFSPTDALVPGDAFPSHSTSGEAPVQEKKLSMGGMASSTTPSPCLPKVLPASTDPLLTVAGSFEGTSGRMASQGSPATSIQASCSNMERNVEPRDPAILFSMPGKSPEVAGRYPTSDKPGSLYSGVSDAFSFSSDPLMISTDSLSSREVFPTVVLPAPVAREDRRGEEVAGASRDCCPPPMWESSSVGMHEVHVGHYPSIQLEAGDDLRARADPLENSLVFDSNSSSDTGTNPSQAKAAPGNSSGLSLPYIIPTVGFAVVSVMAFLVYARLKK
ncbi:MAVS protein, partial [Atlantisia rogersi]|nr:MAVS protein [Atlantisia rogersi]